MNTFYFRQLSPEQEMVFRKAARLAYEPFLDINGVWHPVYQDECAKMNHEAATYAEEEAP